MGKGFFRGAHGVVLVARVREAGICQHNLRVEVREEEAPMTKVGNMSSGTCTCEARAKCVRSQDARPRGVHGMSEEGFLVE